jgi:putative membrane protein
MASVIHHIANPLGDRQTPHQVMKTHFLFLSTLFLCLAAVGADKKASVGASDEKFLKAAADNSFAQAELARLGVQKAGSAEVKELAQMLVTDQTNLNEGLKALAERKAVMLSAVIDPSGATAFRALERFTGKPFDDAFLSRMQSMENRIIDDFEKASKKAEDGDVKSFAEKTLPTLRSHLDRLEKLAPPPSEPPAISIGP